MMRPLPSPPPLRGGGSRSLPRPRSGGGSRSLPPPLRGGGSNSPDGALLRYTRFEQMKRALAAALVVLALFVLLWTRQPIHYVGPSDAANYLAAARSGHVLY